MLLTHATLATMTDGYGLIHDAAVALDGERIAWVGPMADLPAAYRALPEWQCEVALSRPA
jgi:imidazolonepropionase